MYLTHMKLTSWGRWPPLLYILDGRFQDIKMGGTYNTGLSHRDVCNILSENENERIKVWFHSVSQEKKTCSHLPLNNISRFCSTMHWLSPFIIFALAHIKQNEKWTMWGSDDPLLNTYSVILRLIHQEKKSLFFYDWCYFVFFFTTSQLCQSEFMQMPEKTKIRPLRSLRVTELIQSFVNKVFTCAHPEPGWGWASCLVCSSVNSLQVLGDNSQHKKMYKHLHNAVLSPVLVF